MKLYVEKKGIKTTQDEVVKNVSHYFTTVNKKNKRKKINDLNDNIMD